MPGILPEAASCWVVNVPGIRPTMVKEPEEEDFIKDDDDCESEGGCFITYTWVGLVIESSTGLFYYEEGITVQAIQIMTSLQQQQQQQQ